MARKKTKARIGPLDKRPDINTTSVRVLQRINRIGPKTAEAIVNSRPYRSWADLQDRVKGVGPITASIVQKRCKLVAPPEPRKKKVNIDNARVQQGIDVVTGEIVIPREMPKRQRRAPAVVLPVPLITPEQSRLRRIAHKNAG